MLLREVVAGIDLHNQFVQEVNMESRDSIFRDSIWRLCHNKRLYTAPRQEQRGIDFVIHNVG